MTILYGFDTEKKLSPLNVRDALIDCFYKAHCEDTGLADASDSKTIKEYCRNITEQAFIKTNGEYEKPTKESIMNVVGYLVEFSKSFRDPTIIEKHRGEILQLIQAIK